MDMFIHMPSGSGCTLRGLSAPLFLDCLKRFIARRCKPRLVISDNAPQFRLVKTILEQNVSK